MKCISKYLSFVLRHAPSSIGLDLDNQGWANIDELMDKAENAGNKISYEDLIKVVESNDKKRFTLSPDRKYIRAAQGHSIKISLGLDSKQPPLHLYHGTAIRFLGSILTHGIHPQSRQYVHLSDSDTSARQVGSRHGKPVVLKIEALRMYQQGFEFFQADNGVWLTGNVAVDFLSILPNQPAG